MRKTIFIVLLLSISAPVRAEVRGAKRKDVTAFDTAIIQEEPEKKPVADSPKGKVLSSDRGADTLVISQDEKQKWKVKDQVCVTRNQLEISCGVVIEANQKEALVKLATVIPTATPGKKIAPEPPKEKPVPKTGDIVVLMPQRDETPKNFHITVNVTSPAEKNRKPTSELPETTATQAPAAKPESKAYLGAGVGAGLNYTFPMVVVELAVSRKFSIGLSPLFINSTESNTQQRAYGGFLIFSYYLTEAAFSGAFLGAGVGGYAINAKSPTLEQNGTQPAGFAVVGWRATINQSIGIGLSAGGQYIAKSTNLTLVSFNGLLPLAKFDVGLSF